MWPLDEVMHENTRRPDRVQRVYAYRHDFIRLRDHAVRRESHERIEVRSCQTIGQIAIDIDEPLAFFHRRTDASRCEDAAKAAAAGADPIGQRALRDQIHVDFPGDHLFLGHGIGADVRYSRFRDASGVNQLADATARERGVIANHGQSACARATSASMKRSGEPTPIKPPNIMLASSGIKTAASAGEIALCIIRSHSGHDVKSGFDNAGDSDHPRCGDAQRRDATSRLYDMGPKGDRGRRPRPPPRVSSKLEMALAAQIFSRSFDPENP